MGLNKCSAGSSIGYWFIFWATVSLRYPTRKQWLFHSNKNLWHWQLRFVPIQTTTVSVEIIIVFCHLYYFLVTITIFWLQFTDTKCRLKIVVLKMSFFCVKIMLDCVPWVLTLYRPAMLFGNIKKYFWGSFQFSILNLKNITPLETLNFIIKAF